LYGKLFDTCTIIAKKSDQAALEFIVAIMFVSTEYLQNNKEEIQMYSTKFWNIQREREREKKKFDNIQCIIYSKKLLI